jgi:hypothetical protein
MNTYVYLWYLAEFFLELDLSDKLCRENQNIYYVQ